MAGSRSARRLALAEAAVAEPRPVRAAGDEPPDLLCAKIARIRRVAAELGVDLLVNARIDVAGADRPVPRETRNGRHVPRYPAQRWRIFAERARGATSPPASCGLDAARWACPAQWT